MDSLKQLIDLSEANNVDVLADAIQDAIEETAKDRELSRADVLSALMLTTGSFVEVDTLDASESQKTAHKKAAAQAAAEAIMNFGQLDRRAQAMLN